MKNVKLGDIITLKSGSPNLIVDWVVDVTKDKKAGIDPNPFLKMSGMLKTGDIAIKWMLGNTEAKGQLPNEAILLEGEKITENTESEITFGSVVERKLDKKKMTVIWVIGQTKDNGVKKVNEFYIVMGQRKEGDLVCAWFEKNKFETGIYPLHEVKSIGF